jgi:hypothetical protein
VNFMSFYLIFALLGATSGATDTSLDQVFLDKIPATENVQYVACNAGKNVEALVLNEEPKSAQFAVITSGHVTELATLHFDEKETKILEASGGEWTYMHAHTEATKLLKMKYQTGNGRDLKVSILSESPKTTCGTYR